MKKRKFRKLLSIVCLSALLNIFVVYSQDGAGNKFIYIPTVSHQTEVHNVNNQSDR